MTRREMLRLASAVSLLSSLLTEDELESISTGLRTGDPEALWRLLDFVNIERMTNDPRNYQYMMAGYKLLRSLEKPATIGQRKQQQARMLRLKHDLSAYSAIINELHAKDPTASWNTILRRAALRLRVSPRTIRRHFPKKNW